MKSADLLTLDLLEKVYSLVEKTAVDDQFTSEDKDAVLIAFSLAIGEKKAEDPNTSPDTDISSHQRGYLNRLLRR